MNHNFLGNALSCISPTAFYGRSPNESPFLSKPLTIEEQKTLSRLLKCKKINLLVQGIDPKTHSIAIPTSCPCCPLIACFPLTSFESRNIIPQDFFAITLINSAHTIYFFSIPDVDEFQKRIQSLFRLLVLLPFNCLLPADLL